MNNNYAKQKKGVMTRLVVTLLAVVMLCAALPTAVMAADNDTIVFAHQEQSNRSFANQDRNNPGKVNTVKFIVVLANDDGSFDMVDGRPDVTLPAGSVVPDSYTFRVGQNGVLNIGENTFSGISVPGYSYAGSYAYFGWTGNSDVKEMAVVNTFKNFGHVSNNYTYYNSYIGFTTPRGTGNDYEYDSSRDHKFNTDTKGYYAYNPTGVLMIVLMPVNEDVKYRTNYHNDFVTGGTANIVAFTYAEMIKGSWIPDEYKYDWYGNSIMTEYDAANLTSPGDGYVFDGWYDSVDASGNGTGNKIVGITENGKYYAVREGTTEKIEIRQNNDFYARWVKRSPEAVPDTTYITVQKTFAGLTEAQIPDGFTITVKNSSSAVVATLNKDNTVSKTTNGDGDIVWTWKVENLDAGSYTVLETGETVTNYNVTTTGTGSVTTQAANMTIGTPHIEPSCSEGNHNIGTVKLICAQLTQGAGNFVWTDVTLSANQRAVVIDFLNNTKQGFQGATTANTYFFSGDKIEDGDGLYFREGYINYNADTGVLHFEGTSQWGKFLYGSYTVDGAVNPDIAVNNEYTRKTARLTITKTVSGNMGDWNKDFTFDVTVEGATQTVTLKHEGSQSITVPHGASVTITETNADGYTFSVADIAGVTETTDTAGKSVSFTMPAENVSVTVNNHKEAVIDTGVFLDSVPYIAILALAIAGSIFFVLRKRRKWDDM